MPVEDDYQPKYVDSLYDVPISGPDDYSDEDKRKALFHAEAQLELDVNDGEEIANGDIVDAHRVAAMNLATHILTHSAEDPADVTLGDMASGGGNLVEYSSRYLEAYNMLVDKIVTSAVGSGDSENFAVFVNNGKTGNNSDTYTVQ